MQLRGTGQVCATPTVGILKCPSISCIYTDLIQYLYKTKTPGLDGVVDDESPGGLYPGQLEGASCLTFNGTTDGLDAAHLSGGETVVSSDGTSTPSIAAGRINFTAGTCWNLLLSDGTYYPISETEGLSVQDVSGGGNTALIDGATWTLQDDFHWNAAKGFSRHVGLNGTAGHVTANGATFVPAHDDDWEIEFDCCIHNQGTNDYLIGFGDSSNPLVILGLTTGAGGGTQNRPRIFWRSDGGVTHYNKTSASDAYDGTHHKVKFAYSQGANTVSLFIDDIAKEVWGGASAPTLTTINRVTVGAYVGTAAASLHTPGMIWDVKFTTGGVLRHHWPLYGDAPTVDLIGSDDVTLVATDEPLIPALNDGSGDDPLGKVLTNAPGPEHNDGDYTLNRNPTGAAALTAAGVSLALSPGDVEVNPAFSRNKENNTRADRMLAYSAAKTGVCLTIVNDHTT